MKIGDEIWVHGYIDEIRQETCVIRNEGGYFGTVMSEICCSEPNSAAVDPIQVGDEVFTINMDPVKEAGVVVRVDPEDEYPYYVLSSKGDTQWFNDDQVQKTGRTFPQIIEMFNQLKVDEE